MRERNKIYNIKGFSGTLHEIADHFGINRATLRTRIRNYGIGDIIVSPVPVRDSYEGTIYEIPGFKGNILAFSVKFNVSTMSIRKYLRKGFKMEEALRKIKKVNKVYKVFDFEGTLKEISKHFGIKYATLWFHRDDGTLEEVITKHLNKKKRKGLNV